MNKRIMGQLMTSSYVYWYCLSTSILNKNIKIVSFNELRKKINIISVENTQMLYERSEQYHSEDRMIESWY